MGSRIGGCILGIAVASGIATASASAWAQELGAPETAPCSTCYEGYPPRWSITDPGKPERREGGDSFYPMPVGPDDGPAPPEPQPAADIDDVAPPDPDDQPPAAPPDTPGGPAAPGPSCTPVAPTPPRPSWTAAPLPGDGAIGSDPGHGGLTGLESRFWWAGTDTVDWTQTGQPGLTSDCTVIPAPAAAFTARVVRWHWDLDQDVASTYRPGAPGDPAVRHEYQTKDPDLVVDVELLWIGDPPGGITTPGGARPHPVIEVRSVLTG